MSSSSNRTLRRLAIVGLLFTVVAVGISGVAAAQTTESGGSVVIGENETIDDDLQVFAGDVVIRGTVNGDVQGYAGSMTIAESGTIDGNLNGAAGSVTIAGNVTGESQLSAGSVNVRETGILGDRLRVTAGSLLIDGTVQGDVAAGVQRLDIGSTAVINGDVTHAEDTTLNIDDAATIDGNVSVDPDLNSDSDGGALLGGFPDMGSFLFAIYWGAVSLLFGALLLIAMPASTKSLATAVSDSPLVSGGLGLIGFIGIPIVLLLLILTVIGIPLTAIGFMIYGVMVFVASVLGRYAIGEWLLSYTDMDNRWIALVVGVVSVTLVGQIPIIGWLLAFIVFLLGFGSLLLLSYRAFQNQRTSTPV